MWFKLMVKIYLEEVGVYLVIHKDGEIEDDVKHRVKTRWLKLRKMGSAYGILCD